MKLENGQSYAQTELLIWCKSPKIVWHDFWYYARITTQCERLGL